MRKSDTGDSAWLLHDGPTPGFFNGRVPPEGYIPLAHNDGAPEEARWLTTQELTAYARDAHNLIDLLGHYAKAFAPWVEAFDADRSQEPGVRFFAMIDHGRRHGQFQAH